MMNREDAKESGHCHSSLYLEIRIENLSRTTKYNVTAINGNMNAHSVSRFQITSSKYTSIMLATCDKWACMKCVFIHLRWINFSL
jgi:hypothetical protein